MKINLNQAKQIVDYLDDSSEIIEISEFFGHSGQGLYLYDPEYPEEGSLFLEP